MPTLSGKTALVTEASPGMGRSTALKLAQQGAHVVVHYGNTTAEAFLASDAACWITGGTIRVDGGSKL